MSERMNWNIAGYYVGPRTDSDFDGLGITSDAGYVRWDLSNSVELGHGLSTVARFSRIFSTVTIRMLSAIPRLATTTGSG